MDDGHVILDSLSSLQPVERPLELVASVAPFLNPMVGHAAKLCLEYVRENRLGAEARMKFRLEELTRVFQELAIRRDEEIADRERQFNAMSLVLELARDTGDPGLMLEAMKSFQEYVHSAPALTRDFTHAMEKMRADT